MTAAPPKKKRKLKRRPTGEDAAIAERRVKALDLRKAGASYKRIGEELKVSEATAFGDVQAELQHLAAITHGLAEEVRSLELRRLDDYTLGLTPAARRGDARSVQALMRVGERRAKLLGLDAPTDVTHSGTVGFRWMDERDPE